jgi:hypothetical protein
MCEDRWLDFANWKRANPAEIHEIGRKLPFPVRFCCEIGRKSLRVMLQKVWKFQNPAALVTDLLPVRYEALAKAPAPPYLNSGARYGSETVR